MAEALRATGFKVITTANNHCMDRGKAGVLRTIQALDQVGLVHTGTFASQVDRDRPTVVNCKGFRIGVIAYTFSTNGLPVPDSYLVNKIDPAKIASDAAAARAAGAEVVIACIHWGVEYQRQPSSTQRKQAQQIIAGGVDIILGSHPHVVEPIEVVTTGAGPSQRRGLVFYSMGNLISNQRDDHKDEGILVQIELSRTQSNAVEIKHYSYIPTYVDNSGSSGARVYSIDSALQTEARNSSFVQKLKAARANIVGLLGIKQ
jgi:poly-gamma-glutamate synthesis protein (capsule biosynthesis protein)